jgi:hypothetical protein
MQGKTGAETVGPDLGSPKLSDTKKLPPSVAPDDLRRLALINEHESINCALNAFAAHVISLPPEILAHVLSNLDVRELEPMARAITWLMKEMQARESLPETKKLEHMDTYMNILGTLQEQIEFKRPIERQQREQVQLEQQWLAEAQAYVNQVINLMAF